MKSAIRSVYGIQVLDSRGNPTLSVRVELEDGSIGISSVPSGVSTGEFEAVELRDGDCQSYCGKGVLKALNNVNGPINQELCGLDANDQYEVDCCLINLDGTSNKSNLGANAILGTSLAVAEAAAVSNRMELFQYIGGANACLLPIPFVNVIDGGAHANNSLDIQEFMIVPHGASSFSEAVRMCCEIFHVLGGLLKDDGYNIAVGDEGGYAPLFESTELVFEFLLRAIEISGYRPAEEVSLAIDVAASELAIRDNGQIYYNFSKSLDRTIHTNELIEIYKNWLNCYPIVSISDALSENDVDGWKQITSLLSKKVQLVGDDLFVTSAERIANGIENNLANAVMVKLNQIGTLSETLQAIDIAINGGYGCVISHRAGETTDSVIADLAVGTSTGTIKAGSMSRGERIAKYNRLLWIENQLGANAKYVDSFREQL